MFLYTTGDPKSGSWSQFLVGPTITTERPNELESMRETKFIPFLSQAEKV